MSRPSKFFDDKNVKIYASSCMGKYNSGTQMVYIKNGMEKNMVKNG
jgi:hypothetical protein